MISICWELQNQYHHTSLILFNIPKRLSSPLLTTSPRPLKNGKLQSPETTIAKTESINATVKAFLFSGGASASESKSYKVSTIGMLQKLEKTITNYPAFIKNDFKLGSSSQVCWVDGSLSIDHIERTRETKTLFWIGNPQPNDKGNSKEKLGEESFFSLYDNGTKYALVPTEDYWVSGVSSFQNLIKNVIGPIDIPIKALLRIYAAHTPIGQWMAVPLIIFEK